MQILQACNTRPGVSVPSYASEAEMFPITYSISIFSFSHGLPFFTFPLLSLGSSRVFTECGGCICGEARATTDFGIF